MCWAPRGWVCCTGVEMHQLLTLWCANGRWGGFCGFCMAWVCWCCCPEPDLRRPCSWPCMWSMILRPAPAPQDRVMCVARDEGMCMRILNFHVYVQLQAVVSELITVNLLRSRFCASFLFTCVLSQCLTHLSCVLQPVVQSYRIHLLT